MALDTSMGARMDVSGWSYHANMRSSNRDEASLFAAVQAMRVGIHVLRAVMDDLSRRGDLHPMLIDRVPWTAVFSERARTQMIGQILEAQSQQEDDGHPTTLIDVVGWWKARACGLGASMTGVADVLQSPDEAYPAAGTSERQRGHPPRSGVR